MAVTKKTKITKTKKEAKSIKHGWLNWSVPTKKKLIKPANGICISSFGDFEQDPELLKLFAIAKKQPGSVLNITMNVTIYAEPDVTAIKKFTDNDLLS